MVDCDKEGGARSQTGENSPVQKKKIEQKFTQQSGEN